MTNINGANGRVTGDMTQFIGELAKRADQNNDGNVSGAEFAQFLTQLIEKPGASPEAETRHSASVATIERILRSFAATPAGLADALPSIQKALPGTTRAGQDHLDVPGLGRINVSLSFGSLGGSPVWRAGR